jgi:hypothetical protein
MKVKPLRWSRYQGDSDCLQSKPAKWIDLTACAYCWDVSFINQTGVSETVASGESRSLKHAKRKCQAWWNRFCKSIARSIHP